MNRHIVFATLTFCLILTACGSKELSRSKAAKLIKAQQFESKVQTIPLIEMKATPAQGIEGENAPGARGGLPDYRRYEKAGWITLDVQKCRPMYPGSWCAADISLTPKGMAESAAWTRGTGTYKSLWNIPILHWEFVEVTGISSESPDTAVVEFTNRWVPTRYGKELGEVPSAPETNSFNFRRYDDGWRLIQ